MDNPKKAILARLDGLLTQTNRFQEEIREIRKEVGNWEATNEIMPPKQEVAKDPPSENKMPEKVKPAELEALFYQIDHNFGRETKHQAPIEDKKTEKKPVIAAPIPKPAPARMLPWME